MTTADSHVALYKALKLLKHTATEWSDMIGKPYKGGGGGTGELRRCNLDPQSVQVYYQEYDGATNYHHPPKDFMHHLNAAVQANFDKILADAFATLDEALVEQAKKAEKEYRELMEDCGTLD